MRKDEVYELAGVRRAYLEPDERFAWRLRLDKAVHDEPVVDWHLDGWPPLRFARDELLAD